MPYDGECRIYQTDTNLVASIACYTEGEMSHLAYDRYDGWIGDS